MRVRGTRTRPLSARLLPLQRRVAVTYRQLHYCPGGEGIGSETRAPAAHALVLIPFTLVIHIA